MKRKCSFKKLAALVLSGAMALGVLPLPGLVRDAYAETDTSWISSVAYATKEQLGKVTPPVVAKETGYTGDVTKVGRIKLGRDEKGNVMEWYILGSDSGVSGSNVAIFAASDMIALAQFNTSYKAKDYAATYGTYETTAGDKVWSNHYGASQLRENLKSYVGDTEYKYFSSAERGIMQATKVDTPDYRKSGDEKNPEYYTDPKIYTTEDVLYAAWGSPRCYGSDSDNYADGNSTGAIYVGSGGSRSRNGRCVLLKYLGASKSFWLRTPIAKFDCNAVTARVA